VRRIFFYDLLKLLTEQGENQGACFSYTNISVLDILYSDLSDYIPLNIDLGVSFYDVLPLQNEWKLL
jgi:hypothetical protein